MYPDDTKVTDRALGRGYSQGHVQGQGHQVKKFVLDIKILNIFLIKSRIGTKFSVDNNTSISFIFP